MSAPLDAKREKLWTVAELAEFIKVSQRTIRRRISQKKISVKRYGASVRIPDGEAVRLIEEGWQCHS